MSTKGRESNTKEKRWKSHSLPRKLDIGQQRRSPNPPSTQERKKALASTSSVQNSKKQPSFEKNKPPRSLDKPLPPSKVTSTRSKSNNRNVTGSLAKTTGATKPNVVGKSHALPKSLQTKSSVIVKNKQSNLPTKDLKSNIEKRPSSSSDQEDHKIITQQELDKNITTMDVNILILEDDEQHLDDYNGDLLHGEVQSEDGNEIALCEPSDPIDLDGYESMSESEICSPYNVAINGSVDNEHTNDLNNESNQHHQEKEACDISSYFLDTQVDGKNQELEDEHVLEIIEDLEDVALISNDVENIDSTKPSILEVEEEKPKEVKVEDCGADVPKLAQPALENMVVNKQGTTHGKKDTTTYNDVIEETSSKLREQNKNRVKALVGAFETVISLESDAPQA